MDLGAEKMSNEYKYHSNTEIKEIIIEDGNNTRIEFLPMLDVYAELSPYFFISTENRLLKTLWREYFYLDPHLTEIDAQINYEIFMDDAKSELSKECSVFLPAKDVKISITSDAIHPESASKITIDSTESIRFAPAKVRMEVYEAECYAAKNGESTENRKLIGVFCVEKPVVITFCE